MRYARNVIIATVIAICAFAGLVRAATFSEVVDATLENYETVVLNVRGHQYSRCSPAYDSKFGRTKEQQRVDCMNEHNDLMVLTRKRYAKEIEWIYTQSPEAKSELDAIMKRFSIMIDALILKYSDKSASVGAKN
jgi:hypothetical protein